MLEIKVKLVFFFLYLKEKLFEIKKRGKFKQGLGKKNKTVLSLVYA
jgi:hypothetical protein